MTTGASRVLRYGLTFAAGLVAAPLVASLTIWLVERNERRG